MNKLLRRSVLALCGLVLSVSTSFAQDKPIENPRIIYTGKLLGYFRFPSHQASTAYGCPKLYPLTAGNNGLSPAAFEFLTQRDTDRGAILVGTGDNFAPQLEARVFYPAPPAGNGQYPRSSKEFFFGNGQAWVAFDQVSSVPGLKDKLEQGLGTIPADNVGCFLSAARYAAVVPGKHDFYFGADRVRHLARFMAGIPSSDEYQPVQMLGANLVLNTSRIKPQTILPSQKEDPWFKTEWPADYALLNLKEGQSVYPWFSYVKFKVADLKHQGLLSKLKGLQENFGLIKNTDLDALTRSAADAEERKEIDEIISAVAKIPPHYVCLSDSNANDIKKPVTANSKCTLLGSQQLRLAGNTVASYLPLPKVAVGKNQHFSTLLKGKHYGICRVAGADTFCRRFSVHTPFFSYPHDVATTSHGFTDPDPYVLVKNQNTVIFGVVDTTLGEHVGLLNFSWANTDTKLKTVVSAEDPAEALREQLDYFERHSELYGKTFSGVKILLAQMSPLRARVLSTRFPDFQIVVSAADRDHGTSETVLTTKWTPETRAGSLVAVPQPYFDNEEATGQVHFSWIDARRDGRSWNLSSSFKEPSQIKTKDEPAKGFWDQVDAKLKTCVKPGRVLTDLAEIKNPEKLKWLTLCAMREETRADIAMIQRRDLFSHIPEGSPVGDPQQILDRLIWKGDLLTLLYVPGSAIKQAIKKSGEYESQESFTLSLADGRSRSLDILGISSDPLTEETLINELPIDDKKIYAVATTDYIGAGDTGYPDLASASLNSRTHPRAYPDRLDSISSIVCRKLFSGQVGSCLPPIEREEYLDKSSVAQLTPQKRPGFARRFWDNLPFKVPHNDGPADKTVGALQQHVQQRSIWTLSLRNLSVGFTHWSNSLTDKQIGESFVGVPASGITAVKTQTAFVVLDTRLSRTSHRNEFFIASGIDFKRQSTGDDPQLVAQINNRWTGDAGYVRNLIGGRSPIRLGAVISVHAETPFQRPFTIFTLASKDRLEADQERGIQLLPRLGLRWQNASNVFEFGAQGGYEIDAVSGYRFVTQGNEVKCEPNASETFSDCVTRLSSAPLNAITKDSQAVAILSNRPRAGLYLKFNVAIPLRDMIKYELTEEGDFFFKFGSDNATDTRYRNSMKHSLKFLVFPSLSMGPMYQVLHFKNKIAGDSLLQKQFGFEASFAFDLFNKRELGVQVRRRP